MNVGRVQIRYSETGFQTKDEQLGIASGAQSNLSLSGI